jgi:methionine salvage enolase-phosphatase E1
MDGIFKMISKGMIKGKGYRDRDFEAGVGDEAFDVGKRKEKINLKIIYNRK